MSLDQRLNAIETRTSVIETQMIQVIKDGDKRGDTIDQIKTHLDRQDKILNRFVGALIAVNIFTPVLIKIIFK